MLGFIGKCVIGIDLAASSRNHSGWALLKGNAVKTSLFYTDSEILENMVRNYPALIAVGAPLSLPEKGNFLGKQTEK